MVGDRRSLRTASSSREDLSSIDTLRRNHLADPGNRRQQRDRPAAAVPGGGGARRVLPLPSGPRALRPGDGAAGRRDLRGCAADLLCRRRRAPVRVRATRHHRRPPDAGALARTGPRCRRCGVRALCHGGGLLSVSLRDDARRARRLRVPEVAPGLRCPREAAAPGGRRHRAPDGSCVTADARDFPRSCESCLRRHAGREGAAADHRADGDSRCPVRERVDVLDCGPVDRTSSAGGVALCGSQSTMRPAGRPPTPSGSSGCPW